MDDIRAALHSVARRETGEARLLRAAARGAPAKGRNPHLTPKMRADEALRLILTECLTHAAANAGVLRAHRSVEGLHQLRVALRRLEVTLAAFGAAFEQAWFAEPRGRVKVILSRLSPARDLDVFLDELLGDAARHNGDNFAAVKRAAEEARDRAWGEAQAVVTSEDFTHLLDDVAALSQSNLPMGGGEKLPRAAHRILKHAARRVGKRGVGARTRTDADLHRLRIALKKLRYLTEFFAPLYGAATVKPYLKALKRLQQQLGGLNDIAHARTMALALLRGDADGIAYGAGLIAGYYGAGRKRRVKKAMHCFADFETLTPFWQNRS